ncbi:MAG: glucose-6-phosphate isomerase [Candidatus Limnocylindrales bacterium]
MSVVLRLPTDLQGTVDAAITRAVDERWASRLAARDTTLWTTDSAVAATIANRLGWLDAPAAFTDEIAELEAWADGIRSAGFTHAVVCGMGGSSLAPEVLAQVLPRSAHGVRVAVLDSTDPGAVAATDAASDPATTLWVIATKSGTTTETLAFLAHLWTTTQHRVGRFPASDIGDSFVAVTDPGDSLGAIPHSDVFRETFLNPADVGGRYSALTYVGLVPAALLGLDLAALLQDANAMLARCVVDDAANPGVALGAAIGALARSGRDKLTFVIEPDLAPLGAWLEQLIAESTGKRGTGVVPVDGEPLAGPEAYGSDRVFVRLGRRSHLADTDAAIDALAAAGHPVIELPLEGGAWVAGEFMRWEVATAITGAVLEVDPFDEPNVTESKTNTRTALDDHRHHGAFPSEDPVAVSGILRLYGDATLGLEPGADAAAVLRSHLGRAAADGYHAVQAYLAPTDGRTEVLRGLQGLLRDGTRRATTLGYGPRFLHSTGQLHKGGTPSGCFLQLVASHTDDVPIPGRDETFGVLIDAQALGDRASLASHGLPCLRVHLSDDPDTGLAELAALLREALA